MKRARTLSPRLFAAAGLTVALAAVIAVFSGIGYAGGTAAQAQYGPAPVNTTPPSISGPQPPKVGDVLTANPGVWTSSTPPTYSYQWRRCNTTGAACSNIANATAQTYTVTSSDAGSTLRVTVTAKTSGGTGTADSAQTSIVPAAPAPPPAGKTIAAASVTLPDRLTIDRVRYSPSRLTSRDPFVARFHVENAKGQSVAGALVYAIGLPYSWAQNAPEVQTDANGWASLTITPTRHLPLHRSSALVMFVRARVPDQDLLAGSSSRRLVQITIR